MAKQRKKRSLIPLLLILILAVGCVSSYIYYSQSIKAVSDTSEEVEFKVNTGDTSADILQHLKNENLIKDVNVAKLYIRLYELNNFKSGTFTLNRNMDLQAILEKLNREGLTIVMISHDEEAFKYSNRALILGKENKVIENVLENFEKGEIKFD